MTHPTFKNAIFAMLCRFAIKPLTLGHFSYGFCYWLSGCTIWQQLHSATQRQVVPQHLKPIAHFLRDEQQGRLTSHTAIVHTWHHQIHDERSTDAASLTYTTAGDKSIGLNQDECRDCTTDRKGFIVSHGNTRCSTTLTKNTIQSYQFQVARYDFAEASNNRVSNYV